MELCLDSIRDIERIDERRDSLSVHARIDASESLESLVRLWIALAAEDSLDTLGNDCPSIVKIGSDGLFVEKELAESLESRSDGDEHVAERHADVAQYGRVGKVALETAHRELDSEMLEDGIGNAEVAFRVLIVDRINLMRHSRAAYLTCLDLLLEVLHRDVLPEVLVEIEDDDVDAAEGIEESSEVVVVGDLGSPLLTLDAELLSEELVAELAQLRSG